MRFLSRFDSPSALVAASFTNLKHATPENGFNNNKGVSCVHEHHSLVTMNTSDPVCSPEQSTSVSTIVACQNPASSQLNTDNSEPVLLREKAAATTTHLSMPSDSQLGVAISGKMHTLYRTMQALGVVFHVEFSMNKSRHKVHLACRDSFPTRSPLSMRQSICLKRNSLNDRSGRMQVDVWLMEYRGELREGADVDNARR